MKSVKPQIFIGPYKDHEVAHIVDDTMNDSRLEDLIRRVCMGEVVDGQDLSFQLQDIIDKNYERRFKGEPEGLDGDVCGDSGVA